MRVLQFQSENSSMLELNQEFFISTSVDFCTFDPDALYNFFRELDVSHYISFMSCLISFQTYKLLVLYHFAAFLTLNVVRMF